MEAKTKEDMRIYKYKNCQERKSESWKAGNVRKNSQKRRIKNAEEQGLNESKREHVRSEDSSLLDYDKGRWVSCPDMSREHHSFTLRGQAIENNFLFPFN
jgi:hypothetical protein